MAFDLGEVPVQRLLRAAVGRGLCIRSRACRVSHTLREWINEALLNVFFFVDGYDCQRDVPTAREPFGQSTHLRAFRHRPIGNVIRGTRVVSRAVTYLLV